MPAKIIDGKKLSEKILAEAKKDAEMLKKKGIVPCLAIVQAGNDPASDIYVKKKLQACADCCIESRHVKLSDKISQQEIEEEIEKLNNDEKVHGIIVQLPLPKQIDTARIMELVSKEKDVDGFHPYNSGMNFLEKPVFLPATVKGIMHLIDSVCEIEGKHAVCVGTSNIVGKPTALMLLNSHATVTMCNKYTKNLAEHTRMADILVVAVGKINLIKADMVKQGAIIIDAGINKLPNGKIVGDVDFEKVKEKAGAITPVPGGVGPMTVACVVENTVFAAKRITKIG